MNISKFLSLVLVCAMYVGADACAADGKKSGDSPVTEGEFSKWIVNVLGLARSLPVAPTEKECFGVLLQNGIAPKNGWNATNLVTMGSLARVVVQSLHKQSEVANPQDDKSWIEYLKKINMEFGRISEAMEQLMPLDPAYLGDAAVTSTDPLKKQARFRPLDEQQFGTDLSTIRQVFTVTAPPLPPVTPN